MIGSLPTSVYNEMMFATTIKVEKANHLSGYQIELSFSNGYQGRVDLKDEIWGEVFEPLKDVEYFKAFSKDRWTIGWDCGADFAPEFLYELSLKQESGAH